jgi:hypothetical protein
LRQARRDPQADARRRAGDERGLAHQILHRILLLFSWPLMACGTPGSS